MERRPLRRALLLGCALLAATTAARAVVYPGRSFGPEDGLVTGNATAMFQGSRGQVWLATDEGVARLEGRRVRLLGDEAGLLSPAVTDIAETRDGSLWFATTAGLCRLRPDRLDDQPAFECGAPEAVVEGLAASDGGARLVATTPDGVFRVPLDAAPPRLERVALPLPADCAYVRSRVQRGPGGVWVGTTCGLVHLRDDGGSDAWRTGKPARQAWPLHVDARGAVWLMLEGDENALYGFRPPAGPAAAAWTFDPARSREGSHLPDQGETVRVPLPAPLARGPTMHAASRGNGDEIWVGTTQGAARLREGSLELVGADARLRSGALWVLGTGRDGTVWTSGSGGVHAIRPAGFTTYEDHEGPGAEAVIDLFEDADGVWAVSIEPPDRWRVHRRLGERFESVTVGLPAGAARVWWGFNHKARRDRRGGWWFATPGGLVHHPPSRRLEDLADPSRAVLYANAWLGITDGVWTVFEDSRGALWIGAWPAELLVWEPGAPRPRRIDGFAALGLGAACSFAEGADGAIWIGMYAGAVVRWRDGALTAVPVEVADTPSRIIFDLHVDRDGRVLIAHPWAGVLRIDDPGASEPRALPLTPRDVRRALSVAEDRDGALWIGTRRGIYRRDPGGATPRHFTAGDGLPSMATAPLLVDGDGVLWAGTSLGLARFVGADDAEADPGPPSFLAARVDGRPVAVPWVGTRALGLPRLRAGLHQLELTISNERNIDGAFQYRILDSAAAEAASWSPPIRGSTLRLAGLDAGAYRVEVRASDPLGERVSGAASVELSVAPPWWRTPWAAGLSLALVLAAAVGAYQVRLGRIAQRDRIRKRIAGDLHDEIGTSLARISILSGVAASARSPAEVEPLVQAIGETARSAVDANSDMVWAIDPRRDSLDEVVRRLRAFASGFVEGTGARLVMEERVSERSLALGADVRRNLYLALKEAIANAAKHAGAGEVRLVMSLVDGVLVATVEDDGVGFDPERTRGLAAESVPTGYGLHSMERRVRELGGSLAIESSPGSGTRVTIRVPVGDRNLGARLRSLFRRRPAANPRPRAGAPLRRGDEV